MSQITTTIYEGLCRHDAESQQRGYLGMSSIGSECELKTWHSWRQTSGAITDGRILMLFETGRHVEMIVCRALRLAGFVMRGAYPDPQLKYSDLGGFFSGHPDGIIEDSGGDMILEIKSSNTNKFKQFEEKGVQAVYPAYYSQMQLYTHYQGVGRALFVVMKKDTSDLYTEVVEKDETTAEAMRTRAARVIQTHDAEGRIYIPGQIEGAPNCEECKWCRYKTACFSPSEALQTIQTCRSCAYLRIGADYLPSCGHSSHPAKLADISRACPQWAWVWRTPF